MFPQFLIIKTINILIRNKINSHINKKQVYTRILWTRISNVLKTLKKKDQNISAACDGFFYKKYQFTKKTNNIAQKIII